MSVTYNAPANLGTPEPIVTNVSASNALAESYVGLNYSTDTPLTVLVNADKAPSRKVSIGYVNSGGKRDQTAGVSASSPAGFTIYQVEVPIGP